MSKFYGLLVGIDKYGPSENDLDGCVKDVERVNDYLTTRVDSTDLQVLTNADATRENVMALFDGHLRRASKDDVAVFYYSGHGGRSRAPREYLPFFPGGFHYSFSAFRQKPES